MMHMAKEVKKTEEDNKTVFTSESWKEYIFGLLEPHEFFAGMPRVCGLQRLVPKLIGPIVKNAAKVVSVPNDTNGQRATVEYTVDVLHKEYNNQLVSYTEAADAHPLNIDKKFASFAVAIACTRAEGRALRKLLGLYDVIVKEEEGAEEQDTQRINETQITFIKTRLQGLNINLNKFLEYHNIDPSKARMTSRKDAANLISTINKYQQDTSSIPETLKNNKGV